jgi:hypothetical protein
MTGFGGRSWNTVATTSPSAGWSSEQQPGQIIGVVPMALDTDDPHVGHA